MLRSDRVKLARELRGWTVKEATLAAGVKSPTWYAVENGQRGNVDVDTLEKIARGLGCSSDYLLGLSDQHSQAVMPDGAAALTPDVRLLLAALEQFAPPQRARFMAAVLDLARSC